MIGAASIEERAFAGEVNKRLPDGVKVSPFTIARDGHEPQYCLTVQLGSRRHVIKSEQPFHYDTPHDVVGQITDWIARVAQSNRWTTNLDAADAE